MHANQEWFVQEKFASEHQVLGSLTVNRSRRLFRRRMSAMHHAECFRLTIGQTIF